MGGLPIAHYRVKVIHNASTYNEYFITATGFENLLYQLSKTIEPNLELFKCKIEIERA